MSTHREYHEQEKEQKNKERLAFLGGLKRSVQLHHRLLDNAPQPCLKSSLRSNYDSLISTRPSTAQPKRPLLQNKKQP